MAQAGLPPPPPPGGGHPPIGGGAGAPPPPPPPPGGGGYQFPTKPVLPTRNPVTGEDLSYIGPYQWDQPLAEQAYQNAVNSINQQKATTYLNYGVNQQGHEIDPASNPYGLFQQTQRANADRSQGIESNLHSRGIFGGGVFGQGQAEGQYAAGQANESIANNLLGSDQAFANAAQQAQADLNQRLFQDRLNSINYAQQQGLFTPGVASRTDAQAKQIVQQAAAQWVKSHGSLAAKNKQGQTFQQRLDQYGQALYDPTKVLRFAGHNYGG